MIAYLKAKAHTLWQRICWNAWDYARKRELARQRFNWTGPSSVGEDASPEQRRAVSNEARQLLENRHFQEAFGAVDAALEAQAHGCDPDNKDKTQRIVIAKQLLQAIRREVIRKLDDGYMAEVQIVELERKKKLLRFQR